jgi:DNA-binding SARP family transcriptional activator
VTHAGLADTGSDLPTVEEGHHGYVRSVELGNRRDRTVSYRLNLCGTWRLSQDGRVVAMPSSAQRLVAFVSLNESMSRAFAAGTLWPEVTEQRAHASLRSAAWRASRTAPGLLVAQGDRLGLGDDVAVDVQELRSIFARMLDDPDKDFDLSAWSDALTGDLLPGWYDDWVLVERERLRQMRIHVLESIARRLGDRHRYAEGIEVGMAAVAIAPLRESAHREVIRLHLAEGNVAEALRQFEVCAQLLRSDLGLEPSDLMIDLMQPVLDASANGSTKSLGAST